MITVTATKPTIRETTANYQHMNGDGKMTSSEIRVQYYSFTTKRLKDLRAEVKAKIDAGEALWHSDSLADQLHGLPDLVDAKNKPCFVPHEGDEKKRAAAIQFLDSLDVGNIDAIKKAIDEDVAPKEQPNK